MIGAASLPGSMSNVELSNEQHFQPGEALAITAEFSGCKNCTGDNTLPAHRPQLNCVPNRTAGTHCLKTEMGLDTLRG